MDGQRNRTDGMPVVHRKGVKYRLNLLFDCMFYTYDFGEEAIITSEDLMRHLLTAYEQKNRPCGDQSRTAGHQKDAEPRKPKPVNRGQNS